MGAMHTKDNKTQDTGNRELLETWATLLGCGDRRSPAHRLRGRIVGRGAFYARLIFTFPTVESLLFTDDKRFNRSQGQMLLHL